MSKQIEIVFDMVALKEAVEVVEVILKRGEGRLSDLGATHVLVYALLGDFLKKHYMLDGLPSLLTNAVGYIREAEELGVISQGT